MIGVVVLGALAAMWLLRLTARRIAAHGDARVADEAQAWLDRQGGAAR